MCVYYIYIYTHMSVTYSYTVFIICIYTLEVAYRFERLREAAENFYADRAQ